MGLASIVLLLFLAAVVFTQGGNLKKLANKWGCKMDFITLCFIALLVGVPLVSIFMLYRVEKVYKYRLRVFDDPNYSMSDQLKRLHQLPSYNNMVLHIFKWDWSEYLTKK